MILSPEQIAKQIVDDYIVSRSMDDRELEDAIVAALRAERERAAKVCDAYITELIAKSLPRDPEQDKNGNYFDAVCWHIHILKTRLNSASG